MYYILVVVASVVIATRRSLALSYSEALGNTICYGEVLVIQDRIVSLVDALPAFLHYSLD
jgi:hypothetical protein